jgi:hypothetical protein
MTSSILASSVAACICLGLATPLFAAEPTATGAANPPAPTEKTAAAQPAQQCLTDLRAFDSQMQKDGYWLSGSGYGYGYPMMGGYGLGYGMQEGGIPAKGTTGYRDARPGYDVRTLIAATNILARGGHQQACEDVLATTRDTYKLYVADLKSGKAPTADVPGWQQRQIAAAQPVTAKNASFRSIDRHRCAQPAKHGSRQRRRHRDEPTDRQDRLSDRRPRRDVRDRRKIRCGSLGRLQGDSERESAGARYHQERHGDRPAGEP